MSTDPICTLNVANQNNAFRLISGSATCLRAASLVSDHFPCICHIVHVGYTVYMSVRSDSIWFLYYKIVSNIISVQYHKFIITVWGLWGDLELISLVLIADSQPPGAYCEILGGLVIRKGRGEERRLSCVPALAFRGATESRLTGPAPLPPPPTNQTQCKVGVITYALKSTHWRDDRRFLCPSLDSNSRGNL